MTSTVTSYSIMQLADRIEAAFFIIGGLILLVELARAWFKGLLKVRTLGEVAVSFSTLIPLVLAETFLLTGAYALYYTLSYEFVTWTLPLTWWALVLAFFVADFVYYWEHRIAHQVRLLWTQHAVHHSSRDLNIATAFRFGPLEGLWALIIHLPMVFLGFPPEMVFFGGITVLAYQTWLHTEAIGRLGPLEAVLNTPSHHRVHHGADAKYLDRNYGGVLIIWDRLFGTFQAEEERPRYGLVRDFDSRNPVRVWFSELPGLVHDLKSARSPRDVWQYLFGRPGSAPDETGDAHASNQIADGSSRTPKPG